MRYKHIELLPNIEVIAKEYASGCSLTKLAEKYQLCRRKLSRHLQYLGVHINIDGQKYGHNEIFFDVINTEEKAYWLGFWYADGYITPDSTVVELTLAEKDLVHLEKFRDIISTKHLISRKEVKLKGKVFIAYRLLITNPYIRNALIANGCVPNKSLILKFPSEEIVPKSLRKHFIRGYVDGDGSIGCYLEPMLRLSFSVLGTKEFLTSIQDVFYEEILGYTKVTIGTHGGIFQFSKGGKESVIKVLSYLYDGCSVYLERKRDKYLSALANLVGNNQLYIAEKIGNPEIGNPALKVDSNILANVND